MPGKEMEKKFFREKAIPISESMSALLIRIGSSPATFACVIGKNKYQIWNLTRGRYLWQYYELSEWFCNCVRRRLWCKLRSATLISDIFRDCDERYRIWLQITNVHKRVTKVEHISIPRLHHLSVNLLKQNHECAYHNHVHTNCIHRCSKMAAMKYGFWNMHINLNFVGWSPRWLKSHAQTTIFQ